nr:hypothetical protein [Tanacetum cinerariifolium]
MPNPEDFTNPTTAINMALALMDKAFKLNYSIPTNDNQRISSNPRNRQIAQPACAEGNETGHNGNQIRCYNYRGLGYFTRNCTVKPKRSDDAYLQTQLLIAQKEEADIYAAGTENRPPMLNKENYVPWSSRLLRYAKSRPNEKLIYNSIKNGLYVRRMIPELRDQNREVPMNETFHEQTDDELTEKELKQVEADDQAIQTILLGLHEDIYAAFTSTDGESIESYYHRFSKLMNDFKRNKHFSEKIASNIKFLNNLQPEWNRHVTIVHQTNDLHTVDYTQLYDFLKYNQKEVDDLRAERLAKTHDPLALMANSNNPFNNSVFHQDQPSSSTYIQQPLPNNNNYNPQPSFNQNYMQQPMPNPEDITDPTTAMNMALNVGNQNGLVVVPGETNQNPNRNGNVVAARAERNANQNNGNQIRCYNCRGLGYFARNYRTDKAPVYDSNGSAEVHNYDNCYDKEIFNMFTQEEQYTELLEPIPEPHQVQQNDSNVNYEVSSVKQDKGTVDQHPATVEETCAYFE